MRAKTSEMLTKAQSILSAGIPIPAKELAKSCGLKAASAYRMIRIMRENGVGIIPTKNGYLLAEHAEKRDDVFFLRKLHGRRTSDFIALHGCIKEMQKRWTGIQGQEFKQIILPLKSDHHQLNKSLSILTQKSERLGI